MVSPHFAGETRLAVRPVAGKLVNDALDDVGRLVLAEFGTRIDPRHTQSNADSSACNALRVFGVKV